LWISGALGLQAWRGRPVAAVTAPVAAVPVAAPMVAGAPKEDLPLLYAQAGRRILESYRNSSEFSLHNFDWHKAEIYLDRAAELSGKEDRILGELALTRGYATLERLDGARYSAAAAAKLREYDRAQFALAAEKIPASPDPHLALARLYVYSIPDAGKAMSEFEQAERLGATLGQREFAQEADAYRIVPVARTSRTVASSRRARRRSHSWR
jgi:hypothetical protein